MHFARILTGFYFGRRKKQGADLRQVAGLVLKGLSSRVERTRRPGDWLALVKSGSLVYTEIFKLMKWEVFYFF
jgi:hypothetical protein